MGIRGLTTFIDENVDSCVTFVDLIQEAKSGGLNIIVDFYSFLSFVFLDFYYSVCSYFGNEYLFIPGGEYLLFHRWILRLVSDLKMAGINLIFFADGPRGASLSHTKSKMATLKHRHEVSVQKMYFGLDICCGRAVIEDMGDDISRPLLLDVQLMDSLRTAGFEVHKLAFGEADYVLLQKFRSTGARAILSTDSDFGVFPDCAWMPLKFFDRENDLRLKPVNKHDANLHGFFDSAKPQRLMAGVIRTSDVMQALDLSWEQLVDLSILQGNDFTLPILLSKPKFWRETVKIPKADPTSRHPMLRDAAAFIRSSPGSSLNRNPQFRYFCEAVPEFAVACEHTRKFYNLKLENTDARYQPGQITHCVEQVAPHLMGVHFGMYWHPVVLEDPNLMPIEVLLSDLRSALYLILTGRSLPPLQVEEYGRTWRNSFDHATVFASNIRILPFAEDIGPHPMRSLETIQNILLFQEAGRYNENLIRLYGWKNGFLCLCLRFFLTLNWRQHICIDEEEFMTLVAMAFGASSLDLDFYWRLRVLPSVRCITIFNWFQDVFRHAYYLFGGIFQVRSELPQAKDCLSVALFNTLFMIRYRQNVPNLSNLEIKRAMDDRFDLIYTKRHVIKILTMGHFQFDDNFRR